MLRYKIFGHIMCQRGVKLLTTNMKRKEWLGNLRNLGSLGWCRALSIYYP